MKWFKSREEKNKDLVKEAKRQITLAAKPSSSNEAFAQAKEMVGMFNSMQQNRPEPVASGDFLKNMLEFEKVKSTMQIVNDTNMAKIREKIESEYQDSDDGINPDMIMQILGGFMNQKKPQEADPFSPEARIPTGFPQEPSGAVGEVLPQTVETPLPELSAIERNAVNLAVKKIPKTAKLAFRTLSADKKEAVMNALLDKIEEN